MKGWVYVITNKGLPGLVKIGFTEKDPEYRARDLSDAGHPYPCVVEYEILVNEPRQVEQKTHKMLASKLENKEWFRCGVEDAVAAVRKTVDTGFIYEVYHYRDRVNNDKIWWATELIQFVRSAKNSSSNLSVTEISEGAYELQKLKELNLCGCQISMLPDSIGSLVNLTDLLLMDNNITTLPDSIGELKNLNTLVLGNNKITFLPQGICELKNLESLYLQCNKITHLPEGVGVM